MDATKEAEKHAYSRGYQAGRHRLQSDVERAERERSRVAAEREFWERAFLAALPCAFVADGWKRGEKPINSSTERVELAAGFADYAVESRRKRYG